MVENVFSLWDILLGPLYVIFFFVIAHLYASYRYKKEDPGLYKHFMRGLVLKFIGCIGFVAVYAFYYKGGDTFRYFHNALPLMDTLFKDPGTFFQLLTKKTVDYHQYPSLTNGLKGYYRLDMFRSDTSYQIVRMTTLLGFLSFKSYLVISFFFAFLSYIGVWCLYRTFILLYPFAANALAIPVLYFPSVFFWGSSLMKDSVVLGFVGLLTYCIYQLFFLKKGIFMNAILIIISFIILKTTKEYVIISYAPAIILWVFLSTTNNLPTIGRVLLRPLFLILAVGAIILLAPQVSKISEQYALEQVLATAESTAGYIQRVSIEKGGAAYDLGNISYTPAGLLVAFPKGVTVTMYQPFLFQVRNPVMLLSALESTVVLFFTIYVLIRVGIFRLFRAITRQPFLLASLVFSLFFAFAIGVSTFNYGSLVRYKLPCLPFYGVALIVPLIEVIRKKQEGLQINSTDEA